MKKLTVILVVVLGIPYFAEAQPRIDGVSGTLTHGETVVVSGASFGVKNPAAPLVWDDGSDNPPLSSYYDEVLPTQAQQGAYYNMAYRNVPFRGIDVPHDRMSYILGGAHATNLNGANYLSGNNVSIGVNLTSFNFFAHYWYRVDPLYDESNHPTMGENMKELSLSGQEGELYGGNWGYFQWCNGLVPDVNQTGPVRISRVPVDCPSLPYACSTDQYVVSHNSPIGGWIKMQWEGGYSQVHDNPIVRFTTYPDGHVTNRSHYGGDITTYETLWGCGYPNFNDLRFLGLGGFSRVPRVNEGRNSFRYFAGVYIDDTYARVMIGDNANYDSCTKMEPQIPVQWADGSVTVTVNLGNFTDQDTAYLFVIDSSNNRPAQGYPVTIGAAGPHSPRNLRIRPR